MQKILVVEDELDIQDILKNHLVDAGYEVAVASDGVTGIAMFDDTIDLVLLDIMLPKIDGYGVCEVIRKRSQIPIIMLTAKEEVVDKIIGLELGADDYMTKPFSIREVIARVKANLRKHVLPETEEKKKKNGNKMQIKDMIIDSEKYIAIIGDKKIDLTIKEFELLKMLSSEPDQVFTRE